jgi:hypothetical protein
VANASVDKLKALGLRHGEKLVMALTAALCLFFMFTAASQETISLTPDQVKQAASQAESTLNRNQPPEDILKRLEDEGIKNPGFETIVEQQQKNLLVADNYRPHQLWVSPEPGAGLIRDMPELIAPTELYAYPGRGGALVFELDESGNRLPDPDAAQAADPEKEARRSKTRGSAKAKAREAQKKKEEEEKRKHEEEIRKKAIVGGVAKPAETPTEATAAQGPMKEITRGVRWVSITGVLDYKTLRENYLTALKRPEVAFPHFKQLEVERQVKESDGSWSEWTALDMKRNREILDNLPEEDEEWTPENVRISAIVAPLPFLKAGWWERVHVARMVPKEKLEVAPAPAAGAGGPGEGGTIPYVEPPMATPEPPPMMEMAGGGMEGMYGGGAESTNFEHNDSPELMLRALDFTVDPDATYRFRVRIVVYNPNRGREDVSYGEDTKSVELFGPWSEPTEEVTMPPDVATYALAKEPTIPRKLDQVKFEVVRWLADDGVTVVKPFTAAPGEIIGEVRSADLPILDKSGKKPENRRVDFNSHQLVLDAMGGNQPMPPLGPGLGSQFAVPATSLVVRPDGSVAVRSQANDAHDQVRRDIYDNYTRAVKDLEKKGDKGANPNAPGP